MCKFAVVCVLVFLIGYAFVIGAGATDSGSAARDQAMFAVSIRILDSDNIPVAHASIAAAGLRAVTDNAGNAQLTLPANSYRLAINSEGYTPLDVPVLITGETKLSVHLSPANTTVVYATMNQGVQSNRVSYRADELLPVSSGQPGTPFSVPGYPSETASGGVKAPQYFAPGVAGDHGEPIAQYIRVGDFLVPNNLPANAHGNGYADPNLLINSAVANVDIDSGAFDVRHGNNAVDLAMTYGLQSRLEPFVKLSGDAHDYDVVTGWSPPRASSPGWVGIEVAGGDGFLRLPEHRRQYKVNSQKSLLIGRHTLSLFAAGYYGSSRLPGLVPIDHIPADDTIDPRQSDRTHSSLLVATDTWERSSAEEFQFSGYFRTYSLGLISNFGDGLIRQSEFRTTAGGNINYRRQVSRAFTLDGGSDFRRDAPRNAELSHLDSTGQWQPVTQNDFTIRNLAPYTSVYGDLFPFLRYSAGVRRDQISLDNVDRIMPASSYTMSSGITSPRGTLNLHAPGSTSLPTLTFSYGRAFHTNDPRTRTGSGKTEPFSSSRAYELAITQSISRTDLRLALVRVSNSSQLARLDPDTGLQENIGASLVRSLMISARHRSSFATLQATFARANSIETTTRELLPEAPRLIWDFSATSIRLPASFKASAEFEYVGRKPLGEGFIARAEKTLNAQVIRSLGERLDAGLNLVLANGFSGQTLETLSLPDEPVPFERIVGIRKASFVGVTFSYRLRAFSQ